MSEPFFQNFTEDAPRVIPGFCEATRNDGSTCKAWAWGGTRFCYAHRHYALFALAIDRAKHNSPEPGKTNSS